MPRQPELLDEDAGRSAWAATSSFMEMLSNATWEVATDFSASSPGSRQQWEVVPASEINLLWNEFAKWGQVRNDEALARIIERFKENAAKLYANTVLAGHTAEDPDKYDLEETPEKDFGDWILDDAGAWRISDYGLDQLVSLCLKVDEAKNAEEALMLLDQMLNVIHPRSDLAAMFVEGGTNLLDHLFAKEGPAPSFQGAMRAETVPAFAGSSGGNERNEIPERLDPPSGWISNPSSPEVPDPVDRPSIFWPKTKLSGWLARAMALEH